jgi:SAM-dependent methyltransferase
MFDFKGQSSFLLGRLKAFINFEAGLDFVGVPATKKNLWKSEDQLNDSASSRQKLEATEPTKLDANAPSYRAYVGRPDEWDLVAARQVMLLMAAGLRENHNLLDLGCGALRAGRLLIPYLRSGNYFGIEPNKWLVEEGIKHELGEDLVRIKQPRFQHVSDFSVDVFGEKFDFAVAHSVFSHTYPDLALVGFRGIARSLSPKGKLFATFFEGEPSTEGSGWLYPGLVPYGWEHMERIVRKSGMVCRCLDWMQPRQSWLVAALPENEEEIDALSCQLRPLQIQGSFL